MVKNIVEQLRRDEGVVEHAYEDSLGYLTIGVGFLIDKKKGGRIPEPVIDFWLQYEIREKRSELIASLPWFTKLDDARQGVLLNMAFNLGTTGLLNFKETLALVESGKYSDAAKEMLNSRWANQVGKRADRLSRQMQTGQWV